MGNTFAPRGLVAVIPEPVTVTPEPGTAAAQAGMLPAGQPRSSFRRGLGVFGENKQADGGLALRVPFQPPLAWDAMLGVLRARAIPGVEHVSDVGYRRTVVIDDDPGVIELTPEGPENLVLRAHLPHWAGLIHVVRRVRRIFSLDAEAGRADHDLGRAARRTAIRALARAVADRTVDLSQVGGPPALVDSLAAIPAMTAATAHRLAMRLGEPDAFPSGNPALLQALSVITGHPAEAAEAERIAGRWRPRRAHAATHLLLSAAGTPRPSWAATSPPD